MPNIFYKIQFKTELEGLNLELKKSKCQGLLIPKKHFFKKDKQTGKNYIDTHFVRVLSSFDKKVILYENYYNYRPSLVNPANIAKKKDKKKLQNKFNEFKSRCNEKDIETFFLKELSEYNDIITLVNKFTSSKPVSGIKKLFGEKQNFEILGFTIPYIPIIQSSYGIKKGYFMDLAECNSKAIDIFYNITIKLLKKQNLDNQYFTLTLVLEDFIENIYSIPNILKKCAPFTKVALWIIDFNEINSTRKEIEYFKKLILNLQENTPALFIYYTGLYSTRLVEKISPKISNFIRINGYPGLNINIPAIIQRTKRFLFQENGKFYNPSAFSSEFLTTSTPIKYSCKCSVCNDFKINDFEKAYNFFVNNPIYNEDYNEFRGRAKKFLENKLKAKQNSFLMKHNFHNLDYQLHMKREDFKSLMFSKNNGINNWKNYI